MFKKGDSPIPGYRLIKFLGRGQYGEVWAAEGPGGTQLALKFIQLQSKSGGIELKAVQAVKLIRHAHLIPISAVWLLDHEGKVLDSDALDKVSSPRADETLDLSGIDYHQRSAFLVIAMALADKSLEDRLKEAIEAGESGIPAKELLEYMRQAAKGLDFLNEKKHVIAGETVGVIHRDIKPANLLLIGDTVVVGDFGVATTLKEFDATATSMLGSLGFMSPESISQRPSATTDQYALAITYYWLRTNTLPYAQTVSIDQLIDMHRSGTLSFDLVSPEEQKIIRKATAADPKHRYASCVEFVDALADLHRGTEPQKSTPTTPMIAGMIMVLALVIVAVALFAKFWPSPNRDLVSAPLSRDHTLTLAPNDIEFELSIPGRDAEDAIKSKGTASFQLADDERIAIRTLSKPPFYESFEHEYSVDELEKSGWRIEVPRTSLDQIEAKAFSLLKDGQQAAAVELLKKAALESPAILEFAADDSVQIDGEVVRIAVNSKASELAIASLKDTVCRPGLLFLADAVQQHRLKSPPTPESKEIFVEAMFFHNQSARLLIVRADSIWGWSYADEDNSYLPIWKAIADQNVRLTVADLSADERKLAVGDRDGVLRVWDLSSDKFGEPQEHKTQDVAITNLFFNERGDAVTIVDDRSMNRINLVAGTEQTPAESISLPNAAKDEIDFAARAGADAIAVVMGKQVFLISGSEAQLTELEGIELNGGVTMIKGSADGKLLLVATDSLSEYVTVWNLQSRKKIFTFDEKSLKGGLSDACFSVDGRWLCVASYAGAMSVLDLSEAEISGDADQVQAEPEVLTFPDAETAYRSHVAFSADSKTLISTIHDAESRDSSCQVEIWDFERSTTLLRAKLLLPESSLSE